MKRFIFIYEFNESGRMVLESVCFCLEIFLWNFPRASPCWSDSDKMSFYPL